MSPSRARPIGNLPNLLSIYRLGAAPIAAWAAYAGLRDLFYILLIISLFTDLVDGPLARRMGRHSTLGARLDTIADGCTLLVGICGLWVFEAETLSGELPWLYLFLGSYAAAAAACIAKFRCLPAYHLYLSKLGAIGSGVFFIWLYVLGYSPTLFIGVILIGVLANCESLLATWRLDRFQSDIGSIFRLGKHGNG